MFIEYIYSITYPRYKQQYSNYIPNIYGVLNIFIYCSLEKSQLFVFSNLIVQRWSKYGFVLELYSTLPPSSKA